MSSLFLLSLLLVLRMIVEYYFILPIHGSFYDLSFPHFSLDLVTLLLSYMCGILFYATSRYFELGKKQSELLAQHAYTELKLLKAQVQPHFLFNTLNNIYFLALSKDDKAADAIAKLSEIMRYFTDYASKERVPLTAETEFIHNYIELERMRIPRPVKIDFFLQALEKEFYIPPMLLIPLVENLFKHGLENLNGKESIRLNLLYQDGILTFQTSNPKPRVSTGDGGQGLANLRERLQILFGSRFTMNITTEHDNFIAKIQFPMP